MTNCWTRLAWIAVVSVLAAGPGDATTVVTVQTPIVAGKAMSFDLDVFVWGAGRHPTRSDQFARLEAEIQDLVSQRTTAAGYEFEADVDHWLNVDQAYYVQTGRPHYRLQAELEVRPIYAEDGSEVAFAFGLEVSLFAEFTRPETWIERYSGRNLGGAVPSDFSDRVQELMAYLLDVVFSKGNSYEPFHETRTLLGGRYSVDLVGWGFENYREYMLGGSREDTRIDLFLEPRSENPLPLASFGVPGRPPRILMDDDARYLVIENGLTGVLYSPRTYEIRRLDGTIIRRVSTDDLLASRDQRRLPRVPKARLDSERRALVVEIPTCFPGGSYQRFELDCAEGDHVDLAVDLETGRILQPIRYLLPFVGGQFATSDLDVEVDLEEHRIRSVRCRSERGRQGP